MKAAAVAIVMLFDNFEIVCFDIEYFGDALRVIVV